MATLSSGVPPLRAVPARRSLLGLSLAALAALLVLLALGTWQVQRLAWKTELLQRIEAQTAAPPVLLPARIDDPAVWDYRRVTVEGEFLHDRELHLAARTHQGWLGYHVVTPLRRTDAGAGQAVLVDRGWVPVERRDPASRPEGQTTGIVTVEGILRRPGGQGWLQPDNQPVANTWFWTDLPAMAEAAGVGAVPPLLLEAGPGAADLPVGGLTRIDLPNDHLGYALTWYGLAAALVAVYTAFVLRHRASPP